MIPINEANNVELMNLLSASGNPSLKCHTRALPEDYKNLQGNISYLEETVEGQPNSRSPPSW